MNLLILWDIDGTLVRLGEVGAVVFDRALEAALGTRPPGRVTMSGKTDQQIVGEYLTMLEFTEHDVHLPLVLEHLEQELAAVEEEIRLSGGVIASAAGFLERAAQQDGVLQSVVTGNIAPNAAVKLAAFGLDRFIDLEIGAYGSDHVDRDRLVPIARARAQALRGRQFASEEIWVIGDTPRDLACARAAGVRCLLVGTGRIPLAELAPLGADATVADLSDGDGVWKILTS